MSRPVHLAPLAGIIVTVFMWAAAYPAIGLALAGFTPFGLAAIRYLVAASALAALALAAPPGLPLRQDLWRIFSAGALGITAYNLLINFSQTMVSAGTAGLLVNINPVIAALLGYFFLGDRLRLIGWIGIAISFAGAATIAVSRFEGALTFNWGAGLVLLAAFCLAAMFIVQKPLLARYRPLSLAMWIVWSGSLLLLPFLPSGLASIPDASASAVGAAIFLGIGPGALGYVAWSYALAHYPVSRASSYLYLVAPLVLLLAYLSLGEIPTLVTIAGGLLTLAGVFIVNSFGKLPPSPPVAGSLGEGSHLPPR